NWSVKAIRRKTTDTGRMSYLHHVLKLHQGRREQLHLERLYMGIVIILVKLFWKKPEQRYKYEPIQDDLELGSSNFPVVYKVSIGAACNLSWLADRLVIQVLDDSTEPAIKVVLLLQMVEMWNARDGEVNVTLWFEWGKIQTPTDEVVVPYDSLAPTPE
ncbi:hypothetical protein S83_050886, partial [Arachis hypogaea]